MDRIEQQRSLGRARLVRQLRSASLLACTVLAVTGAHFAATGLRAQQADIAPFAPTEVPAADADPAAPARSPDAPSEPVVPGVVDNEDHSPVWREPERQVQVFRLNSAKAESVAATLSKLFDPKDVKVETLEGENAIAVHCTPTQNEGIAELLKQLDMREVTRPTSPNYAIPVPHPTYRFPEQSATSAFAAQASQQLTEVRKQNQEIRELVRKHQAVKDLAEAERLRKDLVTLTEAQFDARQKMRQAEVERLKTRLEEVSKAVDRREELKARIVERRVEELLSENEALRWDMPSQLQPDPYGNTGAPAPVPSPVRVVPRQVTEYTETADGERQQNTKTVYSLEHVVASDSGFLPEMASSQDPLGGSQSTSRYSLAEAQARWQEAQREVDRVESLVQRGFVTSRELEQAKSVERLAQLALERAKADHHGRTRILELELEAAQARLNTLKQSGAKGSTPQERARWSGEIVQAEIAVEKVRTLLDLHLQSGNTSADPRPQEVAPDQAPAQTVPRR